MLRNFCLVGSIRVKEFDHRIGGGGCFKGDFSRFVGKVVFTCPSVNFGSL